MRSPFGFSLPVFALFIQALFFFAMTSRAQLPLLHTVLLCSVLSLGVCLTWILFKEQDERGLPLSHVLRPAAWREESRRIWRQVLLVTLSAAAILCAAGWFTGTLY